MEPGSGYHLIFLILTATVLGSLEQNCTELGKNVHISTISTEIQENSSDTVTIRCHFDCTLINETKHYIYPVWTVQKPDKYTPAERVTQSRTKNLWIILHSTVVDNNICYKNEGNFSLHLNGTSITHYNNSIVNCGLHISTQTNIVHPFFAENANFIQITETVTSSIATSLSHTFSSEVITPSSSFPDVPSLSTVSLTPVSSLSTASEVSPTPSSTASEVCPTPVPSSSRVSPTPVPSSSRVSPTPIPTLTLSDAFNSPEVMSSLGGVFVVGALVGAVVGGGLILLFVRRRDAAMRRDAANRIDAANGIGDAADGEEIHANGDMW